MAQQKTSFPEFGFVRLPQILACFPICESLAPAPQPGVLRISGSLLNA